MLLSFVFLQYRSSKPHIAELVKLPNTNYYRNIRRFPNGEVNDNYLIVRLDDQLYFANSDYFKETLYRLLEKRITPPSYIIIQSANMHNIDSTGLYILEDIFIDLKEKNIEILFTDLIGPVRDILTRVGFMQKTGNDHQFMNIQDALTYIDSSNKDVNKSQKHSLQYNERKFSFFRKFFK